MALRIKSKVDLKELEKFGFDDEGDRYFYYEFTEPNENSELRLYVEKETRELSTGIDMYCSPYKVHDKIYDLIQAGLVEKVEDLENELEKLKQIAKIEKIKKKKKNSKSNEELLDSWDSISK